LNIYDISSILITSNGELKTPRAGNQTQVAENNYFQKSKSEIQDRIDQMDSSAKSQSLFLAPEKKAGRAIKSIIIVVGLLSKKTHHFLRQCPLCQFKSGLKNCAITHEIRSYCPAGFADQGGEQ
jgi:hypothetical protein